jgi:hypothetical protein
VQNKKK